MTNGIAGLPAVAAPVNAASETRPDEDTGQASFASLFAGAAQALAQQPVRVVVKPEGTSELDASSDTEVADDSDDTGDVSDAEGDNALSSTAQSNPVVGGVERSIAALDPALQERLGRVMARMRAETGHDVQVGETYRSQSRQNALFEQGRSSPGPVVTWTQNSKHTQGRAVDVLVDEGSAGRGAYATLRRIANEEGLRSLGERDPGHLELPSNPSRMPILRSAVTTMAAKSTVATPAAVATVATTATAVAAPSRVNIARVASVATVANTLTIPTIANVAVTATVPVTSTTALDPAIVSRNPVAPEAPTEYRVTSATTAAISVETKSVRPLAAARVAPIMRPTLASSLIRPVADAEQAPPVEANVAGITGRAVTGNPRLGANSEERSQQGANDRDGNAYDAAFGIGRRANEFTIPNLVAATSTSAAQRAADVMAAYEDAPARPLSQIVMAVDADNGTTDRIQLDLRGSSLNAKIDTNDQHAANAMGARKGELVRALTRDGLEVESLEVRAAVAIAATAGPDSAHRSSDSSSNARSERGAQWQQQQDRQRSENERRQQQRDERGGKK